MVQLELAIELAIQEPGLVDAHLKLLMLILAAQPELEQLKLVMLQSTQLEEPMLVVEMMQSMGLITARLVFRRSPVAQLAALVALLKLELTIHS